MSEASRNGRLLAWAVPILNEVAALGRSVILARMLGPEELGRAMLLALTLRLVEMASDVAIERLLAQSPDGDEPKFQANMHAAVLTRGAAMAVLLAMIAWPMAMAFDGGPTTYSYLLLAATPMVRAFLHLDYRRWERVFNYRGLAVVDGASALIMLASAPVMAWLIGDHRALIAIIFIQIASQVALSHLVGKRRYQLAFDREPLTRVGRFGAPLIVNSILMFITFQADRMIVAGYFTWADVGVYGVALQLALLPAQIAGRAATSLLSPRFRIAIADGRLAAAVPPAMKLYAAMAIVFVAGYGLLAQPMMLLVYGPGFEAATPLIWLLALAAALRIVRTPISQLSVAMARTGDPARANILRAFAVIPALGAAAMGMPLASLAAAAAIGEALAAWRGWRLVKDGLAAMTTPETKETQT